MGGRAFETRVARHHRNRRRAGDVRGEQKNDGVGWRVADGDGKVRGASFAVMGIEGLPFVMVGRRLRLLRSIVIDRVRVAILRTAMFCEVDDIVPECIVVVHEGMEVAHLLC